MEITLTIWKMFSPYGFLLFRYCGYYKKNKFLRAYSRLFYHTQPCALGFEKKFFLLTMVKNDICLGDASKQNVFFKKNKCTPKNAPFSAKSRIGPGVRFYDQNFFGQVR